MRSPAVISNVLSYGNRRTLAAIDRLTAAAAVPHLKLNGVAGLSAALDTLAANDVSVLAINGGDGTVQAVLTELLGRRPFAALPRIVILRGGQTNQTAADIGPRGSNVAALARLLSLWPDADPHLKTTERAVIRVHDETSTIDQYGMFFGDAAIVETIERCKSQAHVIGLSADMASALTLADAVIARVFRRDDRSLFRGHAATVVIDGEPLTPDHWTVQLATTLNRLVLKSRPLWGCGDAPLRWMGIRHPAPGLLWMAPEILYGGEQRRLPTGICFSRAGHCINITSHEPYTIDGEIFTTTGMRSIELTADATIPVVTF